MLHILLHKNKECYSLTPIEKQKLEMKKTTVALNFVSKLKKKILKKNHIELSESEAYP